ncbi:MAG: hypothetical protein IJI35_05175, partial [Kiritimatiellae bacterium]|nr:hypothetical protein [Kiritimatiellia bacterium]
FSAKCDISPKFTRWRIERIVQLLPSAAKATAEELSDAGHPSGVYGRIADQIACRINQLFSS